VNKPRLVGEQQKQVGADQRGDERRKIVVVAHADFFGADSVVLVHHRHNPLFEQDCECVARVEITMAVLHIGCASAKSGRCECRKCRTSDPTCSSGAAGRLRPTSACSEWWPAGLGNPSVARPAAMAPDEQTTTSLPLLCSSAHWRTNLDDTRLVELLAATGQNVGAKFDDDSLVHAGKYSGCGAGLVKP
jgi:hypothetical protein